MRGNSTRRSREPRVNRTCEVCGIKFSVLACQLRRTGCRYCSRACYRLQPRKPVEERFWSKVSKGDGCWAWTGSVDTANGNGSGRVHVPGNEVPQVASRVSWQLHYGDIPDGLWVLHKCDNMNCVRPDHLFLGTHRDNMLDMVRKGRHRRVGLKGMDHPMRKLSDGDVLAVRAMYNTGRFLPCVIGELFSVTPECVSRIIRRQTWRHII